VVKMITPKEYDRLVREKKYCPFCKKKDKKDVKLIKKEIVETEKKDGKVIEKKYLKLCCPLKHGSLYRIKRLEN